MANPEHSKVNLDGGETHAARLAFAGGAFTPPLTKGMLRPFGNPGARPDSSPPPSSGAFSGFFVIQLGVDSWNQWREENFHISPDLSGADLSHLKLHYAQLHAVNLESANFWKAELIGADLQGANLASANLRKAELQAANLSFSTLTGANMAGSKMATTILGANDLSGVQGLKDVRHSALSIIGIETIYRSKGVIPEAFLRGCGVPRSLHHLRPLTYDQAHRILLLLHQLLLRRP
jgi:hypothetical protein